MSRNIGTFNFAANLEGLLKAPIDAKQLVGTYADLTLPGTWNASGQVWLYNGAIVAVGSDPISSNNGIYWLCNATGYTSASNWIKAGSGSGTITGATNGIGISGQKVCLGGTLVATTDISGAQDLSFGGITPLTSFGVQAVTDFELTVPSNKATLTLNDTGRASLIGGQYADISTSANTAIVRVSASTVSICGTVRLLTTPSIGSTSDTILVWNSVDNCVKQVDGGSIIASSITGVTNGLTKFNCHNACLGGSLTSDVTLNLNGHIFNICGAPGSDFISLNDPSVSACFGTNLALSTTILQNNLYSLTLSSVPQAVFHDNNCIGLCYDGDYEANFVNRSLVTAQYVLGHITGGTGIAFACNGLTKSGNAVILGGNLIGPTEIIQTGNTFSICTTSVGVTPLFVMNPSNSSIDLGVYCSSTRYSVICSCDVALPTTGIYSINGTSCSSVIAEMKLSLNSCNGTCGTTVCLSEKGLCYGNDYSGRWDTCRYIPDIGYITGYTQCAISCNSNVDTICQVIAPYTTLPGDNFIGVCGASCICLLNSPTPRYGQKVTIADIRGDALCNPIQINGGIYLINNCYCSLINTDYGSITFIFNCNNFWSAIAFVN